MRHSILISTVFFAAFCAAGCLAKHKGEVNGQPTTKAVIADSDVHAPANGPVVPANGTVHIVAQRYKYVPNVFRAKPGQHVQITLINQDSMPHSLSIDLGSGKSELKKPIPPGRVGALAFTAPSKPGTYVFYCPIQNHKELGMMGKMIVQ